MKLLLYSHFFAPSVGGVETFVMLLARGLCSLGRDGGTERIGHTGKRSDTTDGAFVVTVVSQTPAGRLDDASAPFSVVRRPTIAALWRLVGKSDVVHLAGPSLLPLAFALLRRKPIVLEHHGFQAVCPNGQLLYEPVRVPCPGHFMARHHHECLRCNAKYGRVRSLWMYVLTFPRRWLCHRVSANIAPTSRVAGILRLPRTTVIYHAVPERDGAFASGPPTTPTFVFLGRLVGTKGVHLLLQAAHRLRAEGLTFRVKIIGAGPEREALDALVDTLKLRDLVAFTGHLPESALERELAAAAAVIVPSLAGEVFGLVAAEQMMRGRLVIAAETGGLGEVVGDAGLTFAVGDVKGLAERMRVALDVPALASRLGRKARDRAVACFTEDRMLAAHAAVYRRVLVSDPPGGRPAELTVGGQGA